MRKGLNLLRVSPLRLLYADITFREKATCCDVCRNKTIFCMFCKWRGCSLQELEEQISKWGLRDGDK